MKEEIEYEIDPEAKERRKYRSQAIKGEILQGMAAKYQLGTVFTDISDEDEVCEKKIITIFRHSLFPV